MTLAQWQQLQPAVARSTQLPNDGVAPGDWDSIGAFQQRLSLGYGGAGTFDEQAARLLDIAYTPGVFFDRLNAVPLWEVMAPGVAAQAVQRSAYPDRYAAYWGDAQALLRALGEHVVAGQQIALVGMSGFTSGPHLHFEVRINGVAIEPLAFLASKGVKY